MSDPTPSRGLLQSGGRVAEQLAGGLTSQPMLIAILALNVLGILTAGYYLLREGEFRSAERLVFADIIKACILEGRHP
jgi:hypothetical protein